VTRQFDKRNLSSSYIGSTNTLEAGVTSQFVKRNLSSSYIGSTNTLDGLEARVTSQLDKRNLSNCACQVPLVPKTQV